MTPDAEADGLWTSDPVWLAYGRAGLVPRGVVTFAAAVERCGHRLTVRRGKLYAAPPLNPQAAAYGRMYERFLVAIVRAVPPGVH